MPTLNFLSYWYSIFEKYSLLTILGHNSKKIYGIYKSYYFQRYIHQKCLNICKAVASTHISLIIG